MDGSNTNRKQIVVLSAGVLALSIASYALWRKFSSRRPAAVSAQKQQQIRPDSRIFWNQKYIEWTKEHSGSAAHLFSMKPADILLSSANVFDRLRDAAGDDPSRVKVLEIGAGQGRNGIHMVKQYGFSVKAVDVSDVACADARQNADDLLGQESAALYDVEEYDVLKENLGEEKYDVILALFVQVTENHAQLHERLMRALKPGGYLVIQGFSPKQLDYVKSGIASGGPPFPENLYDCDDLRKELQGLTVEVLRERDADLTGYGTFEGTCALVEFVGFKPKPE